MSEKFKASLSTTNGGVAVANTQDIIIDEPVAEVIAINYFPSDGAIDIDPSTDIKIQFNQSVLKGTGNILLSKSSGGLIESFDVTSNSVVLDTVSGNTITLNPSAVLSISEGYVITVPPTAIKSKKDTSKFWVGTSSYDFRTSGASTGVVSGGGLNAYSKYEVLVYEIDFTTATGECGIDVTQALEEGPSAEGPDSYQLVWDGQIVAGSGGTADDPVFITTDKAPFTTISKRFPKYNGKFVQVPKPTTANPLEYRFNKSKPYPTSATLTVIRTSATTWHSVPPPGVTILSGKANFELTPNSISFIPPNLNGANGTLHLDKVNDTIVQLDLSVKSDGTYPPDWVYKNQNGGINHAVVGSGFITFSAGNNMQKYTIKNNGTDAGQVTAINVQQSNDQLKAPAKNLFGNNFTTEVTQLRLFAKGGSIVVANASLPVTLQKGESLTFYVTIGWDWTFYSPTFDWVTETGLTSPVTIKKLNTLPNKADIKKKYNDNVVSIMNTLKTNLLRWEVIPTYINDPKLDVSSNIILNSNSNAIVSTDPLAQSFFVNTSENPNGYFVSSIDLFFKQKSLTDDITVQIRPVVNGFPSSTEIVPFAISTLHASQVVTTTYPSVTTNTKFKFDSPIYLSPGVYAIVVISSSSDYELFTATLGNFRLDNLDERIAEPPYAGDLFKSSNSQTWLPSPYQDLCFTINKCNFVPSGNIDFTSRKPISNKALKFNQFSPLTHFNKDSLIRVETSTNLDNIYIVSNSGTVGSTAPTHTTGSVLNGDINLIYVSTEVRWETFNVPFDVLYVQGESVLFDSNLVKYFYKATNTTGDLDADFTELMKDTSYELTERKQIDSESKELFSKIEINTKDNTLSPVIDLTRFSNVLVRNIVNYNTVASDFVPDTYISADEFIKVAFNNVYKMYSVINPGVTSTSAPSFDGSDTLNGDALLRYLGETYNGDTELLPAGGKALSKYITRKVVLADGFESTDLVVRFNANTPAGASIKVYYKAAFVGGYTTLEKTPYTEMILSERDNAFSSKFVEHKFICDYGDILSPGVRYALPDKQPFNQFLIKIVMLSTNTVVVPKIRDLRVIALND